jgi:hypothetical protein
MINVVLLAILAVAVIAVVWVIHVASVAPVTPVGSVITVAPPRPDQPSVRNPANERLANLTSTEQAVVLGKKIGRGCAGVLAFPMGIGDHDADRGDAYWSVRCADGASYAVTIHPDAAGSISVLSCAAMRQAGRECFKPLPAE